MYHSPASSHNNSPIAKRTTKRSFETPSKTVSNFGVSPARVPPATESKSRRRVLAKTPTVKKSLIFNKGFSGRKSSSTATSDTPTFTSNRGVPVAGGRQHLWLASSTDSYAGPSPRLTVDADEHIAYNRIAGRFGKIAEVDGDILLTGSLANGAALAAAVLLVSETVRRASHAVDRVRAILPKEVGKPELAPHHLDLLSTLERPWALALVSTVGVPRLVDAWKAEGAAEVAPELVDFSLVDTFREAAAANRKKRKAAEEELKKAKKQCAALITSAEQMKQALEQEVTNLRNKLEDAQREHTRSLSTMMTAFEEVEAKQAELDAENARLKKLLAKKA